MARTARELGIAFALATVVALTVAAIWLIVLAWPAFGSPQQGIGFLLFALNGPVTAAVGALIISRRPDNRIGRLALVGGSVLAVSALGGAVRRYAEATGDTSALAFAFARLSDLGWVASLAVLALVLQLFPTGRSLSWRWRLVAVATVGWAVTAIVAVMFARYSFSGSRITGLNPTAIPGVVGDALAGLLVTVPIVQILGVLSSLSLLALIVRYRRASEEERAQLKWFVASALFGLGLLFLASAIPTAGWGQALANIGLACIPIAIGIAVLRYRLYDIDILINRTLVYGTVTAMLLGTYALAVLVFRQLFGQLVTGNDLVVAASTLLVATLFQGVRHRVQGLVDRRFYRRKYDAGKMIAAFSARLRQEVDLNSVTHELTRVASEAVQPTHASLWLRRGEEHR